MKHVIKFNDFLKNTVNLNQSRIDTLTSKVNTIDSFLKNDDVFGAIYKATKSQGSYAHKTIIKPSPKKLIFDADVVLYVEENKDWEPKDYIEELYKRFRQSSIYKDKCGRGTRCVTIDYAGEFHLDIVPCIHREHFILEDTYHVCNKNENTEETTDPQGYANWLLEKNTDVGGNNLIKVIRLLKYLRDIKQTFSCKSVLLTTLIANQVGGYRDFIDPYKDLPTTLKVLVSRLNEYLQANKTMPLVKNPINDEEDFNRNWDQAKYENFRNQIERYHDWINAAFDEQNQSESIKLWQKIFGDDFGKQVVAKSASDMRSSGEVLSSLPVPGYVEKPRWPMLGNKNLPIKVSIHKTNTDQDEELAIARKEFVGQPVAKNLKVRMEYLSGISPTHDLYWQVVNTGQDAINNKCQRGGIFPGGRVRWEDTLYQGVHWVECFLVDKKRKVCTGRSGRYFVNVE